MREVRFCEEVHLIFYTLAKTENRRVPIGAGLSDFYV